MRRAVVGQLGQRSFVSGNGNRQVKRVYVSSLQVHKLVNNDMEQVGCPVG